MLHGPGSSDDPWPGFTFTYPICPTGLAIVLRPSHICPCCNGAAKVIETRVAASNGTRRRRLCCTQESCGHRWTAWDGPRPPKNAGHMRARELGRLSGGRARLGGELTGVGEDLVRLLLTRRDLSHAAAGRQCGVSRETVRQVRLGILHGALCLDLPRWSSCPEITCRVCSHWSSNRCGMGLPDPEEEGVAFASDCALFKPASADSPPAAAAGSRKPVAGSSGR